MAALNSILIAVFIVLLVVVLIIVILVFNSRRSSTTISSTITQSSCQSAPPQPINVVASNPQADIITLTWSQLAAATSYTAYIGTSAGFSLASALQSRSTSSNSTSFGNLTLGQTYYLKLTAQNQCGVSPISPEVHISLLYQFPSRFFIASGTYPSAHVCDSHDNLFIPSDQVGVSLYCNFTDSWANYNSADHTIRENTRPDHCLTRNVNGKVYFSPCIVNSTQTWTYNTPDSSLCSFSNPSTDCLLLTLPYDGFQGPVTWGPKGSAAATSWSIVPI